MNITAVFKQMKTFVLSVYLLVITNMYAVLFQRNIEVDFWRIFMQLFFIQQHFRVTMSVVWKENNIKAPKKSQYNFLLYYKCSAICEADIKLGHWVWRHDVLSQAVRASSSWCWRQTGYATSQSINIVFYVFMVILVSYRRGHYKLLVLGEGLCEYSLRFPLSMWKCNYVIRIT